MILNIIIATMKEKLIELVSNTVLTNDISL